MLINRVHKSYMCKICNKSTGIKICKCQRAFYCSKNCQKVDWNAHRTDCCFKLVDYHSTQKTSGESLNCDSHTIDFNSTEPNNVIANNNNNDIFLQQNNGSDIIHVKHPLTLMQEGKELNLRTLERGGREYDPTPLQYQQPHATTYTDESTTTSINSPQSYTSNNTVVDDFEENLFNSLMYSVVDESTEQEILKNLNIRTDDLLATYTLDNDITSSLTSQTFKEYVPNSQSEEQLLSDKIFDQIQSQESFEFRPETQQLLRETKENLEKELSLFRENQFHETQQIVSETSSIDKMQLGSTNQKHVNHATTPDYNLMRSPEEQLALEEMCCHLIRDLDEYGVCVLDNFMGELKGMKVLGEVKTMYSAGLFKDGQVVTTKNKFDHRHIRSDRIMWIDGKEQGLINIKSLINQVDTVITLANRMRNNGKLGQYKIRERTKAMVACYEGKGSHYVKHIDNPNKDGRCITCIYYLNVNWDVHEDGGLLRIFPDGWVDRVADIEPIFDRITFFWSDRRNPHEVQPSHRRRYAVTLWYFDAHEREQAVRRYQKEREKMLKAAA
ncbi:hypothetical protein ACKWTF_012704 [Chironomus riparius]